MKNLLEFLTPEQQETIKSCYVVVENTMYTISEEPAELTAENFKILLVRPEEGVMVVTIEDLKFYDPDNDDYDYRIVMEDKEECDYVCRDSVPEKVADFLDEELKKREESESEDEANEEAVAADEPKEEPAEEATEE